MGSFYYFFISRLKWIPCLLFRWILPSAAIINSSTWSSWIVSCASKLNGFGMHDARVFFSPFLSVSPTLWLIFSLAAAYRHTCDLETIFTANFNLQCLVYNAFCTHSSAKINSSQLICTDNIAFRLCTFIFCFCCCSTMLLLVFIFNLPHWHSDSHFSSLTI